jgi:hypothetical protein
VSVTVTIFSPLVPTVLTDKFDPSFHEYVFVAFSVVAVNVNASPSQIVSGPLAVICAVGKALR